MFGELRAGGADLYAVAVIPDKEKALRLPPEGFRNELLQNGAPSG